MTIYKYVTLERVDGLRHGRVRFTQAAALNDPFEAHPCLTALRESFEKRQRALLKSFEGQVDAHRIIAREIMIPQKVRDGVMSFNPNWPHHGRCSVLRGSGTIYSCGLTMPTLIVVL